MVEGCSSCFSRTGSSSPSSASETLLTAAPCPLTKQKLARKAKWNELSITKEKDIRDEFESLKRTCDLESMNSFEIANEVRNNMKRTMKKELHHEFEQVKVAYSMNQEYF
ncbi:hypothetical protein NQZ68_025748 [Dissostichus eleginoides]|nr:hypothetical protein NQZ68_025748 [Dissostichus eleginoides]